MFEEDHNPSLHVSTNHIYYLFKQIQENDHNRIAIIDHIGTLSYKELNDYSDQLAQVICEKGVVKGSPVLICLPQSRYYVISILAVLKLGAYYIPMDENYPLERINYMTKDSGAQHILTVDNIIHKFRDSSLQLISADNAINDSVLKMNMGEEQISLGDIACMIYTSGSTGLPKGIALSHRSILNLAYTAAKHFNLSKEDRFLQVSSISFSAALEELYPPLLNGNTIVFQADYTSLSIQDRIDIMHKHNITVCEMVTPLWHELVDYVSSFDMKLPQSLRLMITGGERPLKHQYQRWVEQEIELIHVYGPTESAATASYYHCPIQKDKYNFVSDIIDAEWRLPIGKAIDHTNIYILDHQLNKVPQGNIGEIYISGDSLASYYTNKAALTAAAFLPNPYSMLAGERMYRTGDQGRYLSDGNLEFIGRIDNQIKIRGYRVEPGEVESVIEKHPHIKQAVVLGLENKLSELQLIAFVVANTHEQLTFKEWRSYLVQYIPMYMVPSTIIYLDRIPLTNHGKIDRSLLQMNYFRSLSTKGINILPKNNIENILSTIWKEVFNVQTISCEDDFFDLGGHSLLALRITSQIRHHFNIDIQPNLIMQNANIVQLADVIKGILEDSENNTQLFDMGKINQQRIKIQNTFVKDSEKKEIFPIATSQNGLWFMSQLLPDSALYNVPWQFTLKGKLDRSSFEIALNEIIRRHSVLQSTLKLIEGQPCMIIDRKLSISMIQYDMRHWQGKKLEFEIEKYLKEKSSEPFDLSIAPLIRSYILQIKENEYIVLTNIHHIIFDGWSLEIFMKEWSTIYNSLVHQQPVSLNKIVSDYFDYSMWQAELIRNNKHQNGIIYWQEKLKNIDQFLEPISVDPVKNNLSFNGELIRRSLEKGINEKLQRYSEKSKTTKYMILLTCYKLLLFDFTHQDDIAIGAPSAGGRMVYPFDQHIGYFVNTLVIRQPMNKNMTFNQLLQNIKQTMLDAYKYQSTPLDLIAQSIKPIRKRGRNPLFQTDFLLEEDALQEVNFSELSISDLEDISTGLSKFDLTWIVKQRDDELCVNVNFKTDFLSSSIIESMIKRFEYIINTILNNSELTIQEILEEEESYGHFKNRRNSFRNVDQSI